MLMGNCFIQSEDGSIRGAETCCCYNLSNHLLIVISPEKSQILSCDIVLSQMSCMPLTSRRRSYILTRHLLWAT